MKESIVVAGQVIPSGTRKNIRVKVGELADGSDLNLPVIAVNGADDGARLTVGAAVHGDEVAGTEAAKLVGSTVDPSKLNGAFIAVPALNIMAYLMLERVNVLEVPGGRNDMGQFVRNGGDANGTQAQVIAKLMDEQILSETEYFIEMHSSAKWSWNYPRTVISPQAAKIDERIKQSEMKVAQDSGFEVIFRAKSLTWAGMYFAPDTVFQERTGKPKIVLESGGSPSIEDGELLGNGIKNIMIGLGMLNEPPIPTRPNGSKQIVADRLLAVRASKGGILRMKKNLLGSHVKKGEVVGEITNLFNEPVEQEVAPDDGIVVKVATAGPCFTGNRVAVLATPE